MNLPRWISKFEGRKIAIIGDLILDEFIWGSVRRISPEAPVPVVEVDRESTRLGGAANVAVNLVSLGATPMLVGILGNDSASSSFCENLESHKITRDGLVFDPSRLTTVKSRIIAHQQQVCRTDREDRSPIPKAVRAEVLERASRAIAKADAVILSDYSKGILAEGTAQLLIERARSNESFLAVDPKLRDFAAYRGATVITPNKKETETASGITLESPSDLRRAARKLLEASESKALLVTLGKAGMALFEGDQVFEIETVAREVYDVTGAGDTVIAVFTLAAAAGAPLYEAALLANHAAGVVVGKIGTAAVYPEDLRRSLAS